MKEWLLLLVLQAVPPGRTAFSVAPVDECRGKGACAGAQWSGYYGTWIKQETAEQGAARYRMALEQLERAGEELLCRTVDGTVIERCVPDPTAIDRRSKRVAWRLKSLMLFTLGIAIPESGLREDVQTGRGWAKKASDDGGRGRGPGMEACFGQRHPTIAWRFADAPDELRQRAEAGDKGAREQIARLLLGTDPDAVRRCWRSTMRAIMHARAHCTWSARVENKQVDWDFATASLYGTGTSCFSANAGKTIKRVETFRSLQLKARGFEKRTGGK